MKTTKSILTCITAVCAAIIAFSCNKADLPKEDLSRSTIPYSLAVNPDTKVSYEGGSYAFATGDKIHVVGKVRTDIEGELEYNSSTAKWEGDLSYVTAQGAPTDETVLTATIVHAANADMSSYANAIVGSSTANQLQYAVEHYGLFTADFEFGEENAISLTPKASYLDVTVTFTFDGGTPQMTEGTTYVDLKTSTGTVSGPTQLVQDGSNFKAQFLAAVVGGQDVSGFEITACDRKITFASGTTLACNKKYTVNRTIAFKPQLGDPFWSDGTYGRLQHPSGVSIVGIITYVNDDSTEGDALTEKSVGFGHALVMAMKNSAEEVRWGPTDQCRTPAVNMPQQAIHATSLSGYSNTQIQYNANANITAVISAKEYQGGTNYNGTTTGWFLPAIGQWMYSISMKGFGGADPVEQWINGNHKNWLQEGGMTDLIYVKSGTTNENLLVTSLNNRLQVLANDFGCDYDGFGMTNPSNGHFSDNYWTSTEESAGKAYRMNFGSVETYNDLYWSTFKADARPKGSTYIWEKPFIMKVRPFLAF